MVSQMVGFDTFEEYKVLTIEGNKSVQILGIDTA